MRHENISLVRVYKTNVTEKSQAELILSMIRETFPDSDPSFDLEDCDKVLRVEEKEVPVDNGAVKKLVQKSGYRIEELV